MSYVSLMIQALLYLSQASIIFPTNSHPIQWVYEGLWENCLSLEIIKAENCEEFPKWLECYQIPEEGICVIKNITIKETKEYYFQASFLVQQSTQIFIKANETLNWDVQLSPQQSQIQQVIKLNKGQYALQISADQPSTYLGLINISEKCQPFCRVCNQFNCISCEQNFIFFNYQCVSKRVISQLNSIENKDITFSLSRMPSGTIYIFIQFASINLEDFIIPKLFLKLNTKDYFNITHFFNITEVSSKQENGLLVQFQDLDDSFGKSFRTVANQFSIYFLDIYLTLTQVNIRKIESIITVQTNNKNNSDIKINIQFYVVPTECCIITNILVESTWELISSQQVGNDTESVFRVTIDDPSFQKFKMKVSNAYKYYNKIIDDSFRQIKEINQTKNIGTITFREKMHQNSNSFQMVTIIIIDLIPEEYTEIISSNDMINFNYQIIGNFSEMYFQSMLAYDTFENNNTSDSKEEYSHQEDQRIQILMGILFSFLFILMLIIGIIWLKCQKTQ